MAEPDLIIEAGFSDAKLAQQVQQVVSKYKAAGTAAQKAFQDASGAVAGSQAAKAHVRELDNLKRAYDPVYAASKRYEAEVSKLNRALQVGAIGTQEYATQTRKLNQDFGRVAGLVGDAGNAVTKTAGATRSYGSSLQQVGFQVGDFATQVGAGTSATQALGQQLPQLLGAFGTFGALAGAGAAILIPLGAALFKAAGDAGNLDDQMKALEQSTDDMVSAAEQADRTINSLRGAVGGLADEMTRADQSQAFFTKLRAESDLIGTARSVGSQFGSLAPASVPRQFDGSINLDRARVAQQEQIKAMAELRRETGASEAQLVSLQQAFYRLETANSAEAVARDAANLQEVLAGIANTAGVSAEQVANLGRIATEAGSVRAQAERQVGAAMSEAQKIVEKFGGTTRELRELADQRATAERALADAQKAGNTQLTADLQEVIFNIDGQLEKTRELGRVTDEVFARMAKSINAALGEYASAGFNDLGAKLANMGAPYQGEMAGAAKDIEAANKGLRELIKLRESGGDYNVTLDHGAYTGGPRDLVNMTIDEVLAMQKGMLAHPANNKNSSAAGAYQIVRKTLLSLVDELGLTGNELYDRDMQDRLGDQLIRRRRGQGVGGLQAEWEGLKTVSPAVIQTAMGAQSTPLEDRDVAAARKKSLDEEIQLREKAAEQARQMGEELARTLVTDQQRTALEQQRADAIAKINASDMSKDGKAAAIAEVNAEMQKQLAIMALVEEAKRRGVDIDTKMIGSAMTYREAINAIGEAQKQRLLTDQAVQVQTKDTADATSFYADQQKQLEEGVVDAILAGKGFADVLQSLAQNLAKAALQAALFGSGPSAQGSGGGLFGGLMGGIFGGFKANGGPVSAGRAYVVGERRPELFVPSVAGTIIPRVPSGGEGGGVHVTVSVSPSGEFDARVADISGQVASAHVQAADRALPSRMASYNRNPRVRNG